MTMVASLDTSVSSLPILDNDYDDSSDDGSLLKGSNHEKATTRTRPRNIGKSFSMSERFGNGQLLRGKKKSYLNPRKSRPSVTARDRNKGSVMKSLGKFLSDGTGDGDGDDEGGTVVSGSINKFLGSIGGKKQNDGGGMEGFASLDDYGSDEEEVQIKFHHDSDVHIKPASFHTVATAPPSFCSTFEATFEGHAAETKSKNDDPAAPLQFIPSMNHIMHNSTSEMSGISSIDEIDDDEDDVSVSSTEHSCALNDSVDSFGSFGEEDHDVDESIPSNHDEASKEDDQHKNKSSTRKDHNSDGGRQPRGSASKCDKEDRDSKPRRDRVPAASSETRRSRSKTARQRPRGDGLSSSNHSQRHRSSSNHSTKSIRSTHRRTSSRGAVSTRTRPSKSSNLDTSIRSTGSTKTGPKRSRSLGAIRGGSGSGGGGGGGAGGPSRLSSLPSRSSHGNGNRRPSSQKNLERSNSGNDLREKYQQRSSLHRQTNKELSSSSHRPRMVRQSSEPAIKVDKNENGVGLNAFEW